jgi:hypothetical protein
MAVTAPETAARARLKALVTEAFEDEGLKVLDDRLNESLAQDGPLAAVYPGQTVENPRNGLVATTTIYVQLYRQWDNALDAAQTVDPSLIEEWAERLRRAVRADLDEAGFDAHLWYFRVTKIDYNPDPSGNISRLLATVEAESQNAALVETTG